MRDGGLVAGRRVGGLRVAMANDTVVGLDDFEGLPAR